MTSNGQWWAYPRKRSLLGFNLQPTLCGAEAAACGAEDASPTPCPFRCPRPQRVWKRELVVACNSCRRVDSVL
eukprot:5196200-Pleurochrysis_carterae.AAC.2